MSKRKRFSISDDINQGITDVITAVNENVGSFRYEVIALPRIEVDPDNPRELLLTPEELSIGIDSKDPNLERKKKEKEELDSLSHTIKENGLINPISVFKHGDKYRIIAGERRFLAAHMAKKNNIQARVVEKKPDEIELRVLQWAENNERKNLSLNERLNNIKSIIEAYKKEKPDSDIGPEILKGLTGISKTQAHCYLRVLKAGGYLKECIEKNIINNLDRAVLIASVDDSDLRNELIDASASGSTLSEIKSMIANNKKEKREKVRKGFSENRGATTRFVNLGKTDDINAVKKLIEAVISCSQYNMHTNLFKEINWNSPKDVAAGFKNLLNVLRKDYEK